MWQRGISAYYLKQYDIAAEQFRIHHQVNPDDVENTAWYFLCLAKSQGVERARGEIIPSRGDARPPMMDVLKLYRGEIKPDAFEASLVQQDKSAKFYGLLYLGLYHESLEQPEIAERYIREAVKQDRGGYMLRVAVIDLAMRKLSKKSPER